MGPHFRLSAALLLMAGLATSARGQTANHAAIDQLMTLSGFVPLEEMTFGGRDVRRVLPTDPYYLLPVPGIELERHADGRLTLRAQYRHWKGSVYSLSPAEWDSLALSEAAAFAPPEKSKFKPRPGVVVHCWHGYLAASPSRAASWSACDEATHAAKAYTEAVLLLAMRKKGCSDSEKDTLWRFSECFADRGTLDNPAKEKQLADLRDKWNTQREPGADILARARLALRTARQSPTRSAIAEARAAVFAFGQHQDLLRAILQSSFRAFPDLEEDGDRNTAIILQTRRRWNEDIIAQDRNYIELLEGLGRLEVEEARP